MSRHLAYRHIRDFPAFDRFVDELGVWVDGSRADVGVMSDAASALSGHVRANGIPAEHLVAALQAAPLPSRHVPAVDPGVRHRRDDRHAAALCLLVEACYGFQPALRIVRGLDGRAWVVLLIREGMRWDPEIEMRRHDWLCCATPGDRRYITPVPAGWEQWSDVDLAAAVVQARPDLRGPD